MNRAEKLKKAFLKVTAVLAILAAVILNPYFKYILGVGSCVLYFAENDHFEYDYDDKWIVGNTLENVKERYGEFDTEWSWRVGYYLDVRYTSMFGEPAPYYYYMEYDSDGIIQKTYIDYDMRGG